jgi:hypothetical protein
MLNRFKKLIGALATTALLPTVAFGGPGSSGGNPTMMITSTVKNYLFNAAAPTNQRFSDDADAFDFGLAGFTLQITSVPYDPSQCALTNKVKTTCTLSGGRILVVFGDQSTFLLRFNDTGVGAGRLGQISAEIVATFSQGSRPSAARSSTVKSPKE